MYGNQTLLIDGYISQTFHSQAAEQYFLDLLRNASIPPHTILSYTRREYGFFVRSVPPHIPARFSNPPGHWLLDHSIVSNGTVVPQTMWSPAGTGRRQNVEGAELQMPIFFENKDGGLGLSLEASIDRRCHVLRHAIHPAPLGQRTTTHIRIVWPGYKNYKRQIPTRDESRAHKPITMARFVRLVGRAVNNFLQVRELDSGCADDTRKPWRIGPGGIKRSDIIIIGAVHVSAGSWMPIMQLNRYII